ncbi:NAD(P)H-binding protein [Cognatishimia sp. SS12]|uniref:NAD(P)-dependent oxidoreductase n=1 Tax=Cognatishimia sp. SS12 TaxID=2979465 RepID=UPI00232F13FD|nr:NAD(P)H-binding protein [Cognatishimia sp. SS12]MDC0739183.1 NAD(P)H-binding protein [Cognatishimia sp. SS12]
MKILVLGASGMIGSRIAAEAVARGHDVTGTARNPEKIETAQSKTALTLADVDKLAELATAADVVVSAISPRSSGDAEADALAVANALKSAVGPTGTRIVQVGGAGSMNLPDGTPVAEIVPELYRAEAKAMRVAYETLAASDLDFTFIAPAALIQPGERTGEYRTSTDRTILADSKISAEDYAVALVDEVESAERRGTLFQVAN